LARHKPALFLLRSNLNLNSFGKRHFDRDLDHLDWNRCRYCRYCRFVVVKAFSDEHELSNDVGEAEQDEEGVNGDGEVGQGALLALVGHVKQARQEENDDESAERAGETNDGADGRVIGGKDDADSDDDHVDARDVNHLLLLATNQQQKSLKRVTTHEAVSIF
jgi:hypothetical protein